MFGKITAEDIDGKGVSGLSDTPNLTAGELKAQFDSLPRLLIDKLNDLIDLLNLAGSNLEVTNPSTGETSTLQVALESIKADIPTAISQLTNDNNTVTDANYVHTDLNFTQANQKLLELWDKINTTFVFGAEASTIEGEDYDAIPNSLAIAEYCRRFVANNANINKLTIDGTNNIYIETNYQFVGEDGGDKALPTVLTMQQYVESKETDIKNYVLAQIEQFIVDEVLNGAS